jgi:ABC-type Mn2+/Zn2+ transport systems, permease components
MDDFLVRALIAGIGLAIIAGPLGSFVVWRRMAYFGDTLAHCALLGVALGFFTGINLNLGIFFTCVTLALLVVFLREKQKLSDDTLLGILSHSALSLGLVVLAFMETLRVDLIGYLFGDILAVTVPEIIWLYVGVLVVFIVLCIIWRPLLAMTINDELARVEGTSVRWVQTVFMLLMATVIALAMKIVGILLITSLLIIPPATARRFARTPEQMATIASAFGCVSVVMGLGGSFIWDLPSGPAIVVSASVLFALSAGIPSLKIAAR